jgi:hypothetical protein
MIRKSGTRGIEEMEMHSAKIIAGLMLASCLVAAPASAAGLLGGVLGGGSSTGTSSTGSSLGSTVSNTVNSVLGGGSSTSTGSVGVPGAATASLNSTSAGTQGNATLLGGGGSTVNLGLGGLLGGNSNLGVTLPGTGTGLDGTISGVANTVNGITGNGGTVDTLVGSTGLTGDLGGLGGLLGGNGGSDPGTSGTNDDYGAGAGRGEMASPGLAALGAACRNVDVRGIAALMQSGHYSRRTLDQWHHAANIQVVPVKTCAALRRDIRNAIARNGNVQMVQQLAAADPLVSASLGRTRYSAGSVLGVAQANGTLTVYVY